MIFGLTGGIASGKSTVSRFFREQRVPMADADLIAREVVARGTPGLRKVVVEFGRGILTPAGDLDRAKLGEIVFKDAERRADLDAIVWPMICTRSREVLQSCGHVGHLLSGFDAALLIEKGLAEEYRPLVVVTCSEATQLRRLMLRDGLSEEQARERIAAQLPMAEKVRQANFVLENDSTEEDLREQAAEILWFLRAMTEADVA
jgi:dephospho-CoA kinase